jgi:NOL1/NOP2/sun family putative RNA methylase
LEEEVMSFFLSRYKKLGHDIDPDKIILRQSIRVNTLKVSEEQLVKKLQAKNIAVEKIPFADFGYWVVSDFALSSTSDYLQGHYYIQEAASQLPVQALSPVGGELVLDMCAAPGSKTTQLAQVMRNQGRIVALDSNNARLPALKNNLERCGVKNVVVFNKDASFVDDLGLKFDKVLLDAPCSGNFATDSNWFDKRSIDDIKGMAKVQKSLLRAAVSVLKPSGTILYSTCSLEPEENEEIIEWALDKFPIKLVPIELDTGDEGLTAKTRLCRRFWPEKHATQGFFMAKIVLKR